ncbi:hypothetical protein ACQPZX_29445 [Actinoplanes sp. CA-142083]|uniref:hypothetical protein n=1 Tax=Actinoplanes sp. CA-142083 TaxID=3239903 RepID=UPI003D8E92C6
MTERDPLKYDPETKSFVNALAETLTRETGLQWDGVHKDHSRTGAAMFTALRHDEDGRPVLAGVLVLADIRPYGPGDAVTAETLRKVPVSAIENARSLNQTFDQVQAEIADLTPLKDADRSDPVAFSQLVAEHYKAWARAVPHVVAAMAAEAGVKPPTVHTWVREARLRGFLPPARKRGTR